MKNTNIEKRLEAKGDLSEKEKLIKLASESEISDGFRKISREQSR